MKLTPLADRVILRWWRPGYQGRIILTGSAKEKPSVAEVISVGPGGNVDGKDVVDREARRQGHHQPVRGTKVTPEDVEYVVVRQNDILAIVE